MDEVIGSIVKSYDAVLFNTSQTPINTYAHTHTQRNEEHAEINIDNECNSVDMSRTNNVANLTYTHAHTHTHAHTSNEMPSVINASILPSYP